MEIWSKHRHKKADVIIDQLHQHRVVTSGIELLGKIEIRFKKKELTEEDGTRFKRAIVQGTLGLFKNGALIDEIPRTETVDNVKLLDGFAYKLLSAPADSDNDERAMIAPAVRFDLEDDGSVPLDASPMQLPRAEPSKRKATKKRRKPSTTAKRK